jgi:hypothetical protein
MSLSRELAMMNDEQLREALRILAAKALASGGGRKQLDRWLRPVSHAFHAAGWPKERLTEFMRTAHYELSKARLAHEAHTAASAQSSSDHNWSELRGETK